MILEPMVTRLTDAGLGDPGVNIFINFMPSHVLEGILLRDPYYGTEINYELPNYRKAAFQVTVRGKDYLATQEIATKVVEALTIEETTDLTGMRVNYCRPRNDPYPYAPNEGDFVEWSINVDCCYVQA